MSVINLKIIDFKSTATNSENKFEKITINSEEISSKNIAYVVEWQKSERRSGSAKTKQMSEISGTTAKPFKQKGTGNARQGSKRSVQFVGGRTCFGPTPRSYGFSLPKKIIKKALNDIIKTKISEKKLILVENLHNFDDNKPKTSYLSKNLQKNNINSALFLYDSSNKNTENLVKSVKNIKNAKALPISATNVYDVVKYEYIICDHNLFAEIKKSFIEKNN